jgi:hypothetical protein
MKHRKDVIMATRTVEQIRAELREAEAREAAEREAERERVPVIWQYTLSPLEPDPNWNPRFDPTCSLSRRDGAVTNRAEAEAAGHSTYRMDGGGMVYVFNNGTGRFVTSTGGGRIYTSDPLAFEALSQYLLDHPEGGDVTPIIEEARARRTH